jgi:hypothetical protein
VPGVRIDAYEITITPTVRIRNHIESMAGKTTHFAITLEVEVAPGDWRAVVRYDTTGGQVHRDRLTPNGGYIAHREPVRMGLHLNDAIRNVRLELLRNFLRYVSEFQTLFDGLDCDW